MMISEMGLFGRRSSQVACSLGILLISGGRKISSFFTALFPAYGSAVFIYFVMLIGWLCDVLCPLLAALKFFIGLTATQV